MSPPKSRARVERRAAPRAIAPVRADAAISTVRLRVTLLDVEPPVWRELLVPGDFTFAQLHRVLQAAMGWEDYHLHEFDVGGIRVGMPSPEDKFFPRDRLLRDERKTCVGDMLEGRRKFRYWYDFGDDWWHEIIVGKAAEAGSGAPRLLAGEGACPPEDCGGPYGYAELLQALADPKHPEHRELRQWAGDFDPQRFDFDRAARAVAKAVRRKSVRS
jgi:hypothetical protein